MRPRHVGVLSALALLLGLPGALAAQTGTVRGRVVDATSNQPLSDVQVRVDNSTLGTLTQANGEYILANVPAGRATISARRVGYAVSRQVVDVPAGGTVTQDFALRVTAVTLEEVVVSGVGTATERRALGQNVETISAEQINQAAGVTSIDQALQGKVAGAVIIDNNGQPGGGVSVRLRGTGSILGGGEPLYVVDGVIVDNSSDALISISANATRDNAALSNRLGDISPQDVERIEILKGAAAAALYGSRANNGVIQIFTKRGAAGAPRITLSTEASQSWRPGDYELNMAPTAVHTDVVFGGASAIGAPVDRYDFQDDVFRTATGTSSQLAISGGSAATQYYLSGTWDDEEGIIRGANYGRNSLRANLTQQVNDRFDVTARGNFIRSLTKLIPEGEQSYGVISSIQFTPTTVNQGFDEATGRYRYNPILGPSIFTVIEDMKAEDEVTRFVGGLELSYRPLPSVTLRYLAGIDDYRQESKFFRPPLSMSAAFTGDITNPLLISRQFNNDIVATHTGSFGSDLGFTTTAGFRYTQDRAETIRAAASNLPPGTDLVQGASQSASQGRTEFRTMGGFLEERAAFRDRLFVTAGVNMDASSAFGPDEREQFFPRASASYVLHDEPAFQDAAPDWLSTLRLRAAYGETGGQPPGIYSRFDNYVNVAYNTRAGLVASVTAGNPDLRPERQREIEGGFDLGLMEDRVVIEATGYTKKTTDLVLSVPLPPSRGFSQQFQNIGELENRGIELALNTMNVQTPNFSWSTRLQYASNRNEVTRLVTSADTLQFGYLNYVIEGEPIGIFAGGIYARDGNGNIVYNSTTGLPVRGTDTLDVNGVATVFNARRIIGDPNPDFTASLQNTFTLGERLELGVLLDGRFGNDVANFSRRIAQYFGADKAVEREASGDTTARLYTLNLTRHLIYEEFIEDGSFIKLREVSLAYRVPESLVARANISGMTLRLAGRNLYTWTDYSGIDPEINFFSSSTVSRGVEFATTPLPRSVSLSASVTF
ncbi:MAG TPA: SusC/RagA family TonB-linked outer membrane protein [Gemmatimonadaceae bacterium]